MLNPVICAFIVLTLFVLLAIGFLWVDSVPRDRSKKHKRINWIRRLK